MATKSDRERVIQLFIIPGYRNVTVEAFVVECFQYCIPINPGRAGKQPKDARPL